MKELEYMKDGEDTLIAHNNTIVDTYIGPEILVVWERVIKTLNGLPLHKINITIKHEISFLSRYDGKFKIIVGVEITCENKGGKSFINHCKEKHLDNIPKNIIATPLR